MADFVGGFGDERDVVGDSVELAIGRVDGFVLVLHFSGEPAVEWFPERFSDEEDRHFGHFAFLNE